MTYAFVLTIRLLSEKYGIKRSPFKEQDIIAAGPGHNNVTLDDVDEMYSKFVTAVLLASNSPDPDISNQETLDAMVLYSSSPDYKWKMDLMYQAYILTVKYQLTFRIIVESLTESLLNSYLKTLGPKTMTTLKITLSMNCFLKVSVRFLMLLCKIKISISSLSQSSARSNTTRRISHV
jgi:hypothetical protein